MNSVEYQRVNIVHSHHIFDNFLSRWKVVIFTMLFLTTAGCYLIMAMVIITISKTFSIYFSKLKFVIWENVC